MKMDSEALAKHIMLAVGAGIFGIVLLVLFWPAGVVWFILYFFFFRNRVQRLLEIFPELGDPDRKAAREEKEVAGPLGSWDDFPPKGDS